MEIKYVLGSVMFGIVALCLFWIPEGDIRLLGFIPLVMQWFTIFLQVSDAKGEQDE